MLAELLRLISRSPARPCPDVQTENDRLRPVVAAARADPTKPDMILFESGVNPQGKPFVHLSWHGQRAQMTPEEVRQHARYLFEVAEAAEMDAMVFVWLRDQLGQTPEVAAQLIRDLRQLRGETR